MRHVLVILFALAQLSPTRQALELGRTRDEAMFAAFNRGYELAPGDALDRAEVITEFRRSVLIVREHANLGEFGFSAYDLEKAMAPFAGRVTFIAQARLHPLHTYATLPQFDLYIETGPATPPLAAKPFKRDPVYPPGAEMGAALIAVRLEGTFGREDIERAPAPALVVTDEHANVIWRARIDLGRFR